MRKVRRYLISEEDVKPLLVSGDEFLEVFGKSCIGIELPVDETGQVVVFLVQFSLGLRKVGLKDVAEKFEKRLRIIVVFLEKVGLRRGWKGGRWGSRGVLDRLIDSALNRISL